MYRGNTTSYAKTCRIDIPWISQHKYLPDNPQCPRKSAETQSMLKTLVRTLTIPLHAPYLQRNYNIIRKNMQNIYIMNITTWNIYQINLNVGENLQKLNPCYKMLVRTWTAPLHVPYLLRNYIIIVRKTCRTYIPWVSPHCMLCVWSFSS